MRIVIEVPDECKELGEALSEMATVVRGSIESAGKRGRALDYDAVERKLADAAGKVEREGHRAVLRSLDVDVPAVMIEGARHTRAGRSVASYHSPAGSVEVERTLYRARGGKSVDAVSLRAGVVGEGWLPRTARVMAHEVSQRPSREVEESARENGRYPYSRSSFERVAHLVGEHYIAVHQDVEEALMEEYVLPREAASVSVSLDRVSVPMEEPRPKPRGRPRKGAAKRPVSREFRMAYCGTLTLHDKHGQALHTIRYGTMPGGDAETLAQSLAADAAELLRKVPELLVSSLCDGAPEMWNLLDPVVNEKVLGKPVSRLVDFHHLLEKLAPAAKVIHGEQAAACRERWKFALLNRSRAADCILDELRRSEREQVRVADEQPVHDAITYFENHPGMFDYAAARARGLPIGSGHVEATCKSLFELRFKRGGARWKGETGEQLVHLRALALSDRWADAVTRTLAPLRRAVRVAA